MMKKVILDACCGSRMFWFDKTNPAVLFMDKRKLNTKLCDGRTLEINPDLQADFMNMPFKDNTFHLVVFDPPHVLRAGPKSWLAASATIGICGSPHQPARRPLRKWQRLCAEKIVL